MEKALSARLQRLEDLDALRRLAADYGAGLDDREVERVSSLFTTDGVFEQEGREVHVEGRSGVGAWYAERLGHYGPSLHYPHAQLASIDGDRASGTVVASAEICVDQVAYRGGFRYMDTYQRDDDGWRFKRRTLRFHHLVPMREPAG